MALAQVLARGQITIPREVREQIHLAPGDLVRIEAVGAGKLLVEIVPTLTLEEILKRYHCDEPVDLARLRAEGEVVAAAEVIAKMGEGDARRE